MVLHCWRKVLGRPDLGLDQNFFDAGGHSLLVMRMLAQMNSTLGCKLPTSLLLEAPTARRFAELAVQTKDAPAKYLVPMQPEGSLPPLYLVHHLLGDVLIYRDLANQFGQAARCTAFRRRAIWPIVPSHAAWRTWLLITWPKSSSSKQQTRFILPASPPEASCFLDSAPTHEARGSSRSARTYRWWGARRRRSVADAGEVHEDGGSQDLQNCV